MRFLFKCIAVFIGLTIVFVLVQEFLMGTEVPLAGTLLFGAFASLLLTILYGWIADVFIQKRQPEL